MLCAPFLLFAVQKEMESGTKPKYILKEKRMFVMEG